MAASGGGTFSSNTTPPTLVVGISGNLPVFYQQQGEINKAQADFRTQELTRAKTEAQVVSDVETAWTNFLSTKKLVERMENRLLDRAKRARDLVEIQFRKGAASLLEYLDAQRTYIATNQEYLQDLTNYWTAVYQLEQAVGTDLR
jgi:cobalt-zinc-cadmium efflux system outer membrane protein